MGNYCEQVVHSRYTHLFTVVTAGQRSPGPPAGRDRRAGHPRSGHVKVGVTSYGVCGHLLDSLSAWDHSDTLLKPEQAHFGRFYGIIFFSEGFASLRLRRKEGVTRITKSKRGRAAARWPLAPAGRRDADPIRRKGEREPPGAGRVVCGVLLNLIGLEGRASRAPRPGVGGRVGVASRSAGAPAAARRGAH